MLNKGKNKEVEQEATGASGQGTVNEGEQTPPESTTVALSIFQNKMQELQQKVNLILGLSLQAKQEVEADNPNSRTAGTLKMYEPLLNGVLRQSNTFVDKLQKLEEDIQNKTRILPLIEAKMNSLKSQSSNDEEYKKNQDFLETQQAKVREAVSPIETEFFQLYKKYIGIINFGMTKVAGLEELFAVKNQESELNIQELSLSNKTKKKFVDIFKYAILDLDNLHLRLSKLLQNAIDGNLLDEKDISQVSNNIESWINKYDAFKNRYTKVQNKQNKKEEEIREFISNYNSQITAHASLNQASNRLLSEINKLHISSSKKRQYEKEFKQIGETQSNLRKKRIVDHGIYESKIKKDIENWNSTYEKVVENVLESKKTLKDSFSNLFTILQEEIDRALSLQDDKEEDTSDEDSQEDNFLLPEIPEETLSEIDTLDSTSQESEQPFEVVGKRKEGKIISGKASKKTIPKVSYDREGVLKSIGEHEVNDMNIFRMARDTKLARVEFDPQLKIQKRQELYEKPFFKLNKTTYRFDLLNSGNRDFTWAIETDKDNLSTRIHPFDEAVAYTRQALLTTPLAAHTGSKINGAAVKDKTPFVLENIDGIELMVSDGWGFMKASLAKKLITEIKSKQPSTSTPRLKRPALPNTQMLQWLPLDNKLIFELVENGIKELSQTSAATNQNLPEGVTSVQDNPQNQVNHEDLQKEKLYRAVTTGNFPVRVGTAMPVPGKEVVLPPGILPGNSKVALHRSPADTMNWTTGRVAASENPLSEFIGNLTALQYRWTGHEMGHKEPPFVFFKGLLGVIPDENWPSKYKTMNVDIVVCSEDRKVDEKWKETADIDTAKKTETQFTIQGDFAVSKLLDPGSLIGVAPEMMKDLSGDYDGDEVHLLAQSDSPALFQQIELQEQEKIPNPKLDKDRKFPESSVSSSATQDSPALLNNSFDVLDEKTKTPTEDPAARTLAPRLIDIVLGNQLVGIWSTIADLLSTVNPLRLDKEFTQDIGNEIVGRPLQNQQELWQYVGLGIKAGTDLAKTNLERTQFLGRKLTAQQLMEEGKKLGKFLTQKKKLRSPHKRRNLASIVEDIRNNRRLRVVYNEEYGKLNVRGGHYGNLFEIMLAMDLHLEMTRSGEDLTCKGDLAHTQLERATRAIEKARKWKDEITDQEIFILKIYEILGNLKQILQSNYKENKYARDNGSLWMLLVIKELQPAKFRQELYTQSSPSPAADLQTKYDNLLSQIQILWKQFTYKDVDSSTESIH
ncbi:hypothetical protein [Nostoc sp. NMS4]|uniref:hypothetical protein n=1 Tax=Nostoc sp. NMS4 TaxID=2815390 RepID=UPI0025FB5563|nr:hypothetical protein [Nostoc sp. NMS4]MBN3927899.1 hypothetical protein [Nostoc sp. NMS4]